MQSEELSPEELSALLTSYMPDIPGYRVIRRIGKGGMSYVYLGVQVSLDRQVAIKVMSPEALTDEKSKQRFEQEAHTIAKLEHPCIVGIHEVGRTPQGLLYYVLPYLARGHLGQRDFTLDEARIIEVLRALLSALEYAHTRGIVHRDVKAENVLFDNADRPLLTDFGIALSRRADTSRITTAGLAVGSGGYMSPEQARGEAVDGRADLYSVGVLAYELLNGRLPFLSSDPLALALMHAQDPIPRLPVERKHWQTFLDRSMAKSPDNRFRNAQQMLGVLNQLSTKDRLAAADEPVAGSVAALARPWLRPALFAIAGIALLVMVATMFRAGQEETPKPESFLTGSGMAKPERVAVTTPAPVTAPVVPAPAQTEIAAVATAAVPAAAVPAAADSGTMNNAAAGFPLVTASASVNVLHFDPSLPGAHELRNARHQIKQNRLSTPPGDNASDSLLAAVHAGAPSSETSALSGELLTALSSAIEAALQGKHDESATNAFRRAKKFATDSGQLQSDAWGKLRKSLPQHLLPRLEKSVADSDADAVARTKALARTLDIDPAALEPAWSRVLAAPKPGKVIRSAGPTVVLVQPGSGNRPGVAFTRGEVTRAEYAQFASATGRPIARCRNRLAPITLKKRTWMAPGFPQTGDHPAVCVSFEDASAYARWLSQRTGESYRLPSAAEWRQMANYRSSGKACQDGLVDCGQDAGTVPVSRGPASPLGLTGVRGNAREWLSDCLGSCRQRLVSGLGWRDSAGRAEPLRSSGFDAAVGFDDVGFRLVLEVSPR